MPVLHGADRTHGKIVRFLELYKPRRWIRLVRRLVQCFFWRRERRCLEVPDCNTLRIDKPQLILHAPASIRDLAQSPFENTRGSSSKRVQCVVPNETGPLNSPDRRLCSVCAPFRMVFCHLSSIAAVALLQCLQRSDPACRRCWSSYGHSG